MAGQKTGSTASAPESTFTGLRRFNLVMGFLHLIQGMFMIFVSNDKTYPIFTNYLTFDIAAPMAFLPFSGWKDSFFGDLHGQGMDAVDFFTQKKVLVERWPKEWSRQF